MPSLPRPATPPAAGGVRDAFVGAVGTAVTGYLLSQGVPPELAIPAGAIAVGALTAARKKLMDMFPL